MVRGWVYGSMRDEVVSEAADWHVNSTWTDAESAERLGEARRRHANRLAESNRDRVRERKGVRARVRADYLIALFTIFSMTLAFGSGGLSVGRGQAIADNPTAISGRPAVERMVSVGPGQRRGRVLPPLIAGRTWTSSSLSLPPSPSTSPSSCLSCSLLSLIAHTSRGGARTD